MNSSKSLAVGVRCPSCKSATRHRLLKVVQDRERIIPDGACVLHFAAEPFSQLLVKSTVPKSYTTADLMPGFDLQVDLENLQLPDASYDVVICLHVLEHVGNDRAALINIQRILRPGGILIAMVPIVEGWDATYENPSIVSERDRRLHFGQGDHVRYYGRDFRARLAETGFGVRDYIATPEEVISYRLERGECVFVGQRCY